MRRSVRIAWWPGHSTGRHAGSTWFADRFAIDLEESGVAQVNCDSPGCRRASAFIDLSAMTEIHGLISDAIREVAGKTAQAERPHRAGDHSFNSIGISSFLMLSSTMPVALRAEKGYSAVGGCGGTIARHTENDRLGIADRDNLLRDIRVHALSVLRVTNADALPFDWRAAAAAFLTTIAGYRKKAGDRFDLTLPVWASGCGCSTPGAAMPGRGGPSGRRRSPAPRRRRRRCRCPTPRPTRPAPAWASRR